MAALSGTALGIARLLCLAWGLLLLAFGGFQCMASRPPAVVMEPAAGSRVDTSPLAVTLRFPEAVSADSHVEVAPAFTVEAKGEPVYQTGPRFVADGPDPEDGSRRTVRVALEPGLPAGVYRVSWRTSRGPGQTFRNGEAHFGIGPRRSGTPASGGCRQQRRPDRDVAPEPCHDRRRHHLSAARSASRPARAPVMALREARVDRARPSG